MADLNIPDGYYNLLARIESGNNPNAEAKTSSASGLYQFIKSTWEGLGFNWRDRFNVEKQNEAIQKFTGQNASVLSQAGIVINEATLYAAHFLGAGTAKKALAASDNQPTSNVFSSAVLRANSFLQGMTIGDFKAWLQRKTGVSVSSNPIPAQPPQTMVCPKCKTTYLAV